MTAAGPSTETASGLLSPPGCQRRVPPPSSQEEVSVTNITGLDVLQFELLYCIATLHLINVIPAKILFLLWYNYTC